MDKYEKIYKNKYKLAKSMYTKIFKDDDPYRDYLYYFDVMNVYSLFPTIIDYKITHGISPKLEEIRLNTKPIYLQGTFINTKYKTLVNKKIRELESIPQEIIDDRERNTVRKFFSYEIIDELVKSYGAEYVTVAWMKCYEIIEHYKMLTTASDTVNYFGICEQPGAFVFAINHYCGTHNKKFDFVLESLVDRSNKKIFQPQRELYNEHKNKYDYGEDGTGDVTNMKNIQYYRKKYYNRRFDIISADCGLDCTNDFTLQESNLINVVFGQFILSVALADKGTNYFFKVFTIYDNLMADLVCLLSGLYEKVYVSRVLTTKPDSGEVYIVCKNFLHTKKDTTNLLNDLISWYQIVFPDDTEHDINNTRLLVPNTIPFKFYDELNHINKIFGLRRLISMDMTYFRLYNNKFINKNPEVKEYVKKLADHYSAYFMTLYKISKLDQSKRLVKKEIQSKWVKTPKETSSSTSNQTSNQTCECASDQFKLNVEALSNLNLSVINATYDSINNNMSTLSNYEIIYEPSFTQTSSTIPQLVSSCTIKTHNFFTSFIKKQLGSGNVDFLDIYGSISFHKSKNNKQSKFMHIKLVPTKLANKDVTKYSEVFKKLGFDCSFAQYMVDSVGALDTIKFDNTQFYILTLPSMKKPMILHLLQMLHNGSTDFQISFSNRNCQNIALMYQVVEILASCYEHVYVRKDNFHMFSNFSIVCMTSKGSFSVSPKYDIESKLLHALKKINDYIEMYYSMVSDTMLLNVSGIDMSIANPLRNIQSAQEKSIKNIFKSQNIPFDASYFKT